MVSTRANARAYLTRSFESPQTKKEPHERTRWPSKDNSGSTHWPAVVLLRGVQTGF